MFLDNLAKVIAAFLVTLAGSIAYSRWKWKSERRDKTEVFPSKRRADFMTVVLLAVAVLLFSLSDIVSNVRWVPRPFEIPMLIPSIGLIRGSIFMSRMSMVFAAFASLSLVLLTLHLGTSVSWHLFFRVRDQDLERAILWKRYWTLSTDLFAALPAFSILFYKFSMLLNWELNRSSIGNVENNWVAFVYLSVLFMAFAVQLALVSSYMAIGSKQVRVLLENDEQLYRDWSLMRFRWRIYLITTSVLTTTLAIWI